MSNRAGCYANLAIATGAALAVGQTSAGVNNTRFIHTDGIQNRGAPRSIGNNFGNILDQEITETRNRRNRILNEY